MTAIRRIAMNRKEAIKYILKSLNGLDLWGDNRKKSKKLLKKISEIAKANDCLICFPETYDRTVFRGVVETELSRVGGTFYITNDKQLFTDPKPKNEPYRTIKSGMMTIPDRKDYILPWRTYSKELIYKEFDLKLNKNKFCKGTLFIL